MAQTQSNMAMQVHRYGREIDSLSDLSGLAYKRPFEKGYVTNWELERYIWDDLFSHFGYSDNDVEECGIVLTEPALNFPYIETAYDQLVFELYGFATYLCTPAARLAAWSSSLSETLPMEAALVVDSGFSRTCAIPIINGEIYKPGVKRIDIGGKLMTNYLKEFISFRHYNIMDETWLVNDIKERCSFVSKDFLKDLFIAQRRPRNEISLDYMLPDYSKDKEGQILSQSSLIDGLISEGRQILNLNNERFIPAELLFKPNLIDCKQAGLPEAIIQSIESVPEEYRSILLANIVPVGGNFCIKGILPRLQKELRSLVNESWQCRIHVVAQPITAAWQGGSDLSTLSPAVLSSMSVTRQEYEEHGVNICLRRFGNAKSSG